MCYDLCLVYSKKPSKRGLLAQEADYSKKENPSEEGKEPQGCLTENDMKILG